jgi:hypothetical protein
MKRNDVMKEFIVDCVENEELLVVVITTTHNSHNNTTTTHEIKQVLLPW